MAPRCLSHRVLCREIVNSTNGTLKETSRVIKALDNLFMELLLTKFEDNLGLRPPMASEAIAADESLYKKIFQLVNEQGWTLDEVRPCIRSFLVGAKWASQQGCLMHSP